MGERASSGAEAWSLRDYVSVVQRRKWLAVVPIVVVPVTALLVSFFQTPQYQATAEVLLSRQNLALALIGSTDPSAANPERLLETQAELAEVPALATRTLRAAGMLNRNPRVFLRNSYVSPKKNADLLHFVVVDGDPRVAALLATTFANEFTKYRHELDTASLKQARKQVERRIAELDRLGERDTTVYADLVSKEQQLKTTEALQTSNTLVVRAGGEAFQIAPRPKRNLALGIALGLVLGFGLVFLREALDTRVRTTDELREALGLQLLARLPEPPPDLQLRNQLVMLDDPLSVGAEPYRMLRTNLEFFNLEQQAETIMVTSAVAEEGKSTTIANLALALARGGSRVVLVDLDLRRPILHRFFDLGLYWGITDVVLGRATVDQAVVKQEVYPVDGQALGSLEVIAAGSATLDAGELVSSPELGKALQHLRDRADIVLIDAPPLLAVSDSMALTSHMDALIVVSRLNVLRTHTVSELRRVLDVCPAAKLGLVITGSNTEDDHGQAYGYGRYGEGYGYGHSTRDTRARRGDRRSR